MISLTAGKKHHGALDFIAGRVARVVPLYFVTTLFLIAIKLLVAHQVSSARALWNGFLFFPVLDFESYTNPPNDLGWTLSYEMWFYTVFALFLCAFPAAKVARLLPIFFAVLTLVMTPYRGAWIFPAFAGSPLVLEFSAGCLIYIFQDKIKGPQAWILLATGLIYLLVFSRHIPPLSMHKVDYPLLMWRRIGLWGFPSALIVAGLVGLEMANGFTLPRILTWLGKISFSFYLVQRINISMVVFLGSKIRGLNSGEIVVLAIVLNLILGYACWRVVERPLTLRARAFFDSILPREQEHLPLTKSF